MAPMILNPIQTWNTYHKGVQIYGNLKKQIHANRRNAKRSTGPRNTTKTRFNALRHGILAQKAFIPNGLGHEDEKVFNELLLVLGWHRTRRSSGELVSGEIG